MAKINNKKSLKERIDNELEYYQTHKDERILKPEFPKNIMIDLCNACNHECVFCMNRFMTRKVTRMQPSLYTKIIDQAQNLGVEELGLYATGEPFMHTRLEDFVKEAKDKKFKYVYISTNGALVGHDRLKKVMDAGLDSIKFSINAGSKKTYNLIHGEDEWDKVVDNVFFVSKYRANNNLKLSIFISFVVTNLTKNERKDIEKIFSDRADEIIFVDCDSQQGQMLANEELCKPTNLISTCSLPFNRAHVTSEGYLTLCCVDYQNYLAVADLSKTDLLSAWNSKSFVDMRKRHIEDKLQDTLCENCLRNTDADISPLQSDLATTLNFPKFYKESAEEMKVVLINREENDNN